MIPLNFKGIFSTVTWKQSQVTIIGTIINGILGALFYILVARFLGPSDFGLLTISIATLTLIADIVDFGTNTGLVRYVSANLIDDKNTAFKYIKLALEFKILIWLVVLALGILFSEVIAVYIFNKAELIIPLKLVMVGVGGALLFSFATSSLQAFQKYFIWSAVNVLTNLLRLLFIICFFYFGILNLPITLLSYILLPFFGFSLALLFLPFGKIIQIKNEFSVARKLFTYNFWVAIFTIIAALSSRTDTFLSARLLSSFELGIYGVAFQLVQVVPQLVGALGTVAAPKFASFRSDKEMISYFKKFQLFVLGLAALAILCLPVVVYIIPQILGSAYSTATIPFVILFLAMLIFLISVPLHNSIIFYYGKPQVFIWVSIGNFLITVLLGYILILNYGVIGAAVTVLIGLIFNFLAPLVWFLSKKK